LILFCRFQNHSYYILFFNCIVVCAGKYLTLSLSWRREEHRTRLSCNKNVDNKFSHAAISFLSSFSPMVSPSALLFLFFMCVELPLLKERTEVRFYSPRQKGETNRFRVLCLFKFQIPSFKLQTPSVFTCSLELVT